MYHWKVNGPVPVVAAVKVALWPTVTVCAGAPPFTVLTTGLVSPHPPLHPLMNAKLRVEAKNSRAIRKRTEADTIIENSKPKGTVELRKKTHRGPSSYAGHGHAKARFTSKCNELHEMAIFLDHPDNLCPA
jgi:hypothetical protein